MYHAWKESPESVHVSWRSVFARMDAGALPGQTFAPPPSIAAGQSLEASAVPEGGPSLMSADGVDEKAKVAQLIQEFCELLHLEMTQVAGRAPFWRAIRKRWHRARGPSPGRTR